MRLWIECSIFTGGISSAGVLVSRDVALWGNGCFILFIKLLLDSKRGNSECEGPTDVVDCGTLYALLPHCARVFKLPRLCFVAVSLASHNLGHIPDEGRQLAIEWPAARSCKWPMAKAYVFKFVEKRFWRSYFEVMLFPCEKLEFSIRLWRGDKPLFISSPR
jgi:hypothetical protein